MNIVQDISSQPFLWKLRWFLPDQGLRLLFSCKLWIRMYTNEQEAKGTNYNGKWYMGLPGSRVTSHKSLMLQYQYDVPNIYTDV